MKYSVFLILFVAGLATIVRVQATLASHSSKADVHDYHDAFMRHMENSLSHLNDTLYHWRSHGGAKFEEMLSKASKHSMDALSHLEKVVGTDHRSPKDSSGRRKLSQIYDTTSKEEAQKRLEESKVQAESKIANAVSLIQNAAQSALQTSTADLLGNLTARSALTDIASSGKKISDQLDQYRKIAEFFDRSKNLFSQFIGRAGEVVPAPEPAVGVLSAPVPEPTVDVLSAPVLEPPVEDSNTLLTESGVSDPMFNEFLRNMTTVFSGFDQQATPQDGSARRRLSAIDWTESREKILQNAESSLSAIKALRETGLRVSQETADLIRQKTEQARQKYIGMADSRMKSLHGRNLIEDSVVDSSGGDLPQYLVFPGEADVSMGRSGFSDDLYFTNPGFVETTTYVFIPVSNETMAEGLIDDVLSTIIGALAEAMAAPVYIPQEFFDAYMYTYEENYAPGMEMNSFDSQYREQNKKIARRRRLRSAFSTQADNEEPEVLPYEQYEVTLYSMDPVWFRSAQAQNLVSATENFENVLNGAPRFFLPDDESYQISLAIKMKSPEEFGGLSTDALEFLGLQEPEIIEELFRSFSESQDRYSAGRVPRASMFEYNSRDTTGGTTQASESQSNNLADLIVSKLQNSVYRPSSLAPSDSDMFDMRWLFMMFATAGILMLCIVGAITALKTRAMSGYVVVSNGENTSMAKTLTSEHNTSETNGKPDRKLSNLPA